LVDALQFVDAEALESGDEEGKGEGEEAEMIEDSPGSLVDFVVDTEEEQTSWRERGDRAEELASASKRVRAPRRKLKRPLANK
jgi:hypothetical protein